MGTSIAGEAFFTGAIHRDGDFVGDACLVGQGQEPVFHVARAMQAPKGGAIAVMVVEIKTRGLATAGAANAGEFGNQRRGRLDRCDGRVFTAPGIPPGRRRSKPLQYRLHAEAARRALLRHRASSKAVDYRGVPVLAAYRFVQLTPDLGWGLLVKCDRDEVFARSRKSSAPSWSDCWASP